MWVEDTAFGLFADMMRAVRPPDAPTVAPISFVQHAKDEPPVPEPTRVGRYARGLRAEWGGDV